MLNTMDETDLWNDPVRRYMLPAFADRQRRVAQPPQGQPRDSLHEAEMWVVEGLTHRYPTKVLAELLATCPQYCGHCTRMDLVGNDVPQVDKKRKFDIPQKERYEQILEYLRRTPSVRDVVVSGGDIANMPIQAAGAVRQRADGHPEHPGHPAGQQGPDGHPPALPAGQRARRRWSGWRKKAVERGVDLALHTHVNNAQQVTPLVGRAVAQAARHGLPRRAQPGRAAARRQRQRPRPCWSCASRCSITAKILPYYFYMCDMIPNSEHWRVSASPEAQKLQHDIMGYMPGFATPRIVCDVPFVGKRWVHQVAEYDREKGISYWTKNYRTGIEADDPDALTRKYEYFDPIDTLPEAGQAWWRAQLAQGSKAS